MTGAHEAQHRTTDVDGQEDALLATLNHRRGPRLCHTYRQLGHAGASGPVRNLVGLEYFYLITTPSP
jgi:hypothetical protein